MNTFNINKRITFLLIVSFVIRAFLGYFLELGNDEVYYVNYALYPDFSHFDHPPMVGFFIQLFSLNLLFDSEFFIRLSSIVFGTINTYIIFLIGKQIKNELVGLYSAYLYTASIYCFVISGTFILPDTPLLFFWLTALWFFIKALIPDEITKVQKRYFIIGNVFTGLALLSKYQAAFLLFGVFLYIVFVNRKWLYTKTLYLSFVISFLFLIPVLYWNYQNDFISFLFQSERSITKDFKIHFDYFFTELFGQIMYNNPIVFIAIILAIIFIIKRKVDIDKRYFIFFSFTGIPVILFFLFAGRAT